MNEAFSPAFDELRAGVENATYVAIFYDEYALFECRVTAGQRQPVPLLLDGGRRKTARYVALLDNMS